MSQLNFSEAEYVGKRKKTCREEFLSKMERAVPWKVFADLVDPYYPKPGIGHPPYPLETMRQFVKLPGGRVPDETTILKFCHLLEQHNIPNEALEAVNLLLRDQGVDKRSGHQERDVIWHIAMSPGKRRALGNSAIDWLTQKIERANVEHPFRVINSQFGFLKVRFRGLTKNALHLKMLFTLSNIWMARRPVMAEAG